MPLIKSLWLPLLLFYKVVERKLIPKQFPLDRIFLWGKERYSPFKLLYKEFY